MANCCRQNENEKKNDIKITKNSENNEKEQNTSASQLNNILTKIYVFSFYFQNIKGEEIFFIFFAIKAIYYGFFFS